MPDKDKFVRIILVLSGILLLSVGLYFVRKSIISQEPQVEILGEAVTSGENEKEITFEVSGSVEKPGVYKLASGARVDDALILAGGISADADRLWVEKNLNRAAKITDGQKIYIPSLDQQSMLVTAKDNGAIKPDQSQYTITNSGIININLATLKELDTLPGIGPAYGQKIIDQRPYSSIGELLSKKVLTQKIFDGLKDKISVY